MRKYGFTLIELLVSMAILGILATVGFGNFQSARTKANDVKKKSDLTTIAKSLEAYVNDHGSYPAALNDKILCQPPATTCDWGTAFSDGVSLYLAKLPEEESAGLSYIYQSAGTSYSLYTRLENTNDQSIDSTIMVSCGTSTLCNYKVSSSNVQ